MMSKGYEENVQYYYYDYGNTKQNLLRYHQMPMKLHIKKSKNSVSVAYGENETPFTAGRNDRWFNFYKN